MATPRLTITSRIASVLITRQLKPTDTKETAKIISNQDTKAISTSVSNYFNFTSATLSSSAFTISGKFLFERCENSKGNKEWMEERGGVRTLFIFNVILLFFLSFLSGRGWLWLDTGNQASSETKGQIVGARESLKGRENMARRNVKNSEKSPLGQCLIPDQFQTVSAVLPSDWC